MAVLVAYDGSTPAQQAVEYALREHDGKEIVLIHVIEAAGGSLGAGFNLAKEQLKSEREDVTAEVTADLQELLDTALDVEIETAVGKPAREIVRFAEENDVEEIVIGSHGRTGVSRVLLGSVAEKVARRAPMPVTIVR